LRQRVSIIGQLGGRKKPKNSATDFPGRRV
jgi:hypothetical protein